MRPYEFEGFVNGKAVEHVADMLGPDAVLPQRSMNDLSEAKRVIGRYAELRIAAVQGRWPGRPSVLLSGGIDSAQVYVSLMAAGLDPVGVTVTAKGQDSRDRARGAAVAEALGGGTYSSGAVGR